MNTIGSVLVVLAALIASSGRYQYDGYYIYVASVVFCIQNYIHLTRFEITVLGRGNDSNVPVPVGLCVCVRRCCCCMLCRCMFVLAGGDCRSDN